MALMDEFKKEREELRNGTFKDKLNYFWYYYKWYVIGILCALIVIVTLVYQIATEKEDAFKAVMLNANLLTEDGSYAEDFAEYADIDLNENIVFFDASLYITDDIMDADAYASIQKLTAYTMSEDVDIMVTDAHSFRKYAHNELFYDLRTILSEEQLEKYEPYFYYVDQKTIEELNAYYENSDGSDETTEITYPDPTKPEEMETPIPVGIYLHNSEKLQENFYFTQVEENGEHVVVGIYIFTEHPETALQFLDFVFEE